MPNYVKTGPFVNGSLPGISALFLNAIESVLEQPSGGTETGKYVDQGGTFASAAFISMYTPSISRTAVPVSVTIDTADISPVVLATGPTSQNLTANGFQTVATGSGANSNARCGGNYTINYVLLLIAVPLITLASLLGHGLRI